MRVLAIDPGYDRMGIAVVEGDASKPILLWSDCITPVEKDIPARLAIMQIAVEEALEKYSPDVFALEKLFFSKNVKTALGVAEARGAVLAAAAKANVRIIECSPQDVKLSVTGYGAADKKAIAEMLPKLITLPTKKHGDDELDAIAVGITALAQRIKIQ